MMDMSKLVSREEFDKAVPEVAAELAMKGVEMGKTDAGFIMWMCATVFAAELAKRLFDKNEEEDK